MGLIIGIVMGIGVLCLVVGLIVIQKRKNNIKKMMVNSGGMGMGMSAQNVQGGFSQPSGFQQAPQI
jgi:hypothetical protein